MASQMRAVHAAFFSSLVACCSTETAITSNCRGMISHFQTWLKLMLIYVLFAEWKRTDMIEAMVLLIILLDRSLQKPSCSMHRRYV